MDLVIAGKLMIMAGLGSEIARDINKKTLPILIALSIILTVGVWVHLFRS